jgi:hypothetical protein
MLQIVKMFSLSESRQVFSSQRLILILQIRKSFFSWRSMKKVLATILAFVYLSTSMGATIHLHYCMGKLASWGLIDHEGKNCAECGMVKKATSSSCVVEKMDCCKDEHKQIKTDTDQKLFPSEVFKYNLLVQAITVQELVMPGIEVFSPAVAHPNNNAPPIAGSLPLFVLYRNFRL